MIKILFFALADVATASACAALVRAGGHKARAVDATLLTKADREAADLVFCDADAAANVQAAYDDKPVVVVGHFNPADYLPDRIKAAEAWVRGEADQPEFGSLAAVASQSGAKQDANGDGKVTAAELRQALTEKGIAFKASAPKAELQALLDANA